MIADIYDVFEEIKSTSSTNKKKEILRANKDLNGLMDILVFLFDTRITTGIDKKKLNMFVINDVENPPSEDFRDVINYLAENNSGSYNDVAFCQYYCNMLSEPLRQFAEDLITKSYKMGLSAKTINAVLGQKFIYEHSVQNGYPLEKYPFPAGTWFSVSEKLNGVRATYIDGQFISRQGLVIEGLDHIHKDIIETTYDHMVLDGELRRKNIDKISDNDNFTQTISIVSSDVSKEDLEFIVFDIIPLDEFKNGESKETYKQRYDSLLTFNDMCDCHGAKNVRKVNVFYKGYDQRVIPELLQQMEEEDKEGLMINLDTTYKCKRHRGLLKVKQFYTVDLEIVGFEEGSGAMTGMLGALVCKYHNNTINIGSGFTKDQRQQLWNDRKSLVGRIIEVSYKEETHNKQTGLKSLQFPTFVRFRDDKDYESYN